MATQQTPRKGKRERKLLLEFVDLDRAREKAESGMFVDKGDVKIIYHVLKAYKPSEAELQVYKLLFESFEEILVVDFGEKPPWKK